MVTISRRSALVTSASGALLAAAAGAPAQPATTAAAATPDAPSMKSLQDLIEAARANAPGLAELMTRHLPGLELGGAAAVPASDTVPMGDTTTVGTIASGNVVAVWGQDFLFAVASDEPATISIDRQAPVAMTRVAGTNYWFLLGTSRIGMTHRFTPFSGGRDVGANTVAGYRIAIPFWGTWMSEMRQSPAVSTVERRRIIDLRKCRHRYCPRRSADGLAGLKLRRRPGSDQLPTTDRDRQPGAPKADSADGASVDRTRYRRRKTPTSLSR